MKKVLLILPAFLLTCLAAQAQLIYSKLTDTYIPLTGGTEVYQGVAWEDPFFFDLTSNPEYAMPIGFTFNYRGFELDTLIIYMEGTIASLDSIGTKMTVGAGSGFSTTGTPSLMLMPTNIDLIDQEFAGGTNSSIQFKTTGSAGSRIFKVQYNKAGIHDEYYDNSTANEFMSFQVWLYESTNVIEYHYGQSTITTPAYVSSNAIGVGESVLFSDTLIYALEITGLPGTEDTTYHHDSFFSQFDSGFNGLPADGTVYRFTPGNLGMQEINSFVEAKVFPNPFTNGTTLKIAGKMQFESYRIIGLDGVEHASGKVDNNRIVTGNLAAGTYLLEMRNDKTKAVEKIMLK